MSPPGQLTDYLDRMRRHLRVYIWARGFAAAIASAAMLTIALASIPAVASSPSTLLSCRIVLFIALGITTAWILAWPILRLDSKAVARALERRFPVFNQRLITLTERRAAQADDPFLPLLEESTFAIVQRIRPEPLIGRPRIIGTAAAGLTGLLALAWLVLWSPGAFGNGARALWTGNNGFHIELKAAHKTIRRGSDLSVIARLGGFNAGQANLWIRSVGSTEWKTNPMLPEPGGSEFGLQVANVRENLDYYVEAEGIRSPVARLNVIDLPGVKNIVVTYMNQPQPDRFSSDGDIVAPAGAIVNLSIETDRPMNGGQLVLEEDDPVTLAATHDNKTSASLRVLRDDGYHLSVMYDGELVQVSDEHAIEVMTRDTGPAHGTSLLNGAHSGHVPAGYERAVSEYYKRLSDQQASRR